MEDPIQLPSKARTFRKRHKAYYHSLKRRKPGHVDASFQEAHETAFDCIDCLSCGNCCRTTGPLFTSKDVDRLANRLGMRPGDFTEKYLRIDEDQDYVLQSVPCPFLDLETNECGVYEDRPKACREYPHTNMSGQLKMQKLTLKNAEICPAVFEILQKLSNQA